MILMASVQNLEEALEALYGGADIVDVKNLQEALVGSAHPGIVKQVREAIPLDRHPRRRAQPGGNRCDGLLHRRRPECDLR